MVSEVAPMTPGSLCIPALMAAAAVIHWGGLRGDADRAVGITRLCMLVLILATWVWVCGNTPPDAFASASWRLLVITVPTLGLTYWSAAAAKRVLASPRAF